MVAALQQNYAPSQTSPATFAEVPTADTDFSYISRGIYVGSAGDVALKMAENGATRIFKSVPAGVILPVAATQVIAASTTATVANMLVLA